jgi:hypothetical protein
MDCYHKLGKSLVAARQLRAGQIISEVEVKVRSS